MTGGDAPQTEDHAPAASGRKLENAASNSPENALPAAQYAPIEAQRLPSALLNTLPAPATAVSSDQQQAPAGAASSMHGVTMDATPGGQILRADIPAAKPAVDASILQSAGEQGGELNCALIQPKPRRGDAQRDAEIRATADDSSPRREPGTAAARADAQSSVSSRNAADLFTVLPPVDESAPSPAFARAMQVEASIRLENATQLAAQPVVLEAAQQARLAPSPHGGPSQHATPHFAPQLMTTEAFDHPRLSSQLVRGLHALVNQRGGTMTMRLEPPELGALRVEMTIARGTVAASFQPTSTHAHSLLERGMATLHSALESHGLIVERLVVHSPPPSSASSWGDDRQHDNHMGQRHHHDASDGQRRGRQNHESPRRYVEAAQSAPDIAFGESLEFSGISATLSTNPSSGRFSRAAMWSRRSS